MDNIPNHKTRKAVEAGDRTIGGSHDSKLEYRRRRLVATLSLVAGIIGFCSLATYFAALFLDMAFKYLCMVMAPSAVCLGIACRIKARRCVKLKVVWLANLGIVLGALSLLFLAAVYSLVYLLPF